MSEAVKSLLFILLLSSFARAENKALVSLYGEQLLRPTPYWVKIYDRVENHEILVSATYKDLLWSLKGVGQVKAPLEKVWKKALDFEGFKKYSKYFKKVDYDSESQILKVSVDFMGNEKAFGVHLVYDESVVDEKRIHAKIQEGYFAGLVGVLRVKKIKPNLTEASMFSIYEKDSYFSGIISVFLESLMHYMAAGLRQELEN